MIVRKARSKLLNWFSALHCALSSSVGAGMGFSFVNPTPTCGASKLAPLYRNLRILQIAPICA